MVDEIHAVADDKRGSHLALSLARLDAIVAEAGGTRPQRVGLSATVKPVEEVARFLSGTAACRAGRAPARYGSRGGIAQGRTGRGGKHGDVVGDLRPRCRVDPRAPHDAGVRQHAPALGAGGAPFGRAARGGRRAAASREPVAAASVGCRGALEIGEI